jgi:hypothetical protein
MVAFLMLGLVKTIQGQVDVGISIGEEGLRGFYLAVGDYFKTPEKEIVVIHERHIPDDEIPVVLFIASRAQVSPGVIVDMRLGGKLWWDITLHFDLSPEIYYVPVAVEIKGPPYGNAYGHFKKKPRKEWGTIILTDEEVVSLVNLKFFSEHYQYPPERIIELKTSGKNFVVINDMVKKEKGACGKQGGNKDKGNKGKKSKS